MEIRRLVPWLCRNFPEEAEKVPSGSTLEKELNYLASRGWFPRQVGDHWEVAPS